jgi:hypothetical protein
MIPRFPEFKSLEVSDGSDIQEFTKRFPAYSDFDFVTLWSWDVDENRGVSELNGNLIVRFSDYLTGEIFYSFVGMNKMEDTIKTLFDFATMNKQSTDLRFIPQEMMPMNYLFNDIANALEDPDNHDYIYSIDRLMQYEGSEYAQARNLLSRFTRRNGSISVVDLDLTQETNRNLILGVTEDWQQNKGKFITREEMALQRLLENAYHFELLSFAVYVEGKMVAFAINQTLHGGYAISHFVQANVQYAGLYSFVMQTIAKKVSQRGSKFLNYEQDLGLPGLRQAKKSYSPDHFLKKYAIVAKSE